MHHSVRINRITSYEGPRARYTLPSTNNIIKYIIGNEQKGQCANSSHKATVEASRPNLRNISQHSLIPIDPYFGHQCNQPYLKTNQDAILTQTHSQTLKNFFFFFDEQKE